MDGFVLILAIVVFSVFRSVVAEAKKKQDRKLPDVLDSIAEHDEAQDRALDALRQWEARQRAPKAGGGDVDPARRESVRIPRPGEHRTDVGLPAPRRMQRPAAQREARPAESAESPGAEQTRREAYNAIRDLLAGKTQRPPPPAQTRPDRIQVPERSREPAQGRPATPTRIQDPTPAPRPRIRGRVQRRDESAEPTSRPRGDRPGQGQAAPAGLERLDALQPVARGIVYAELLGKPVAFRDPQEGRGD